MQRYINQEDQLFNCIIKSSIWSLIPRIVTNTYYFQLITQSAYFTQCDTIPYVFLEKERISYPEIQDN